MSKSKIDTAYLKNTFTFISNNCTAAYLSNYIGQQHNHLHRIEISEDDFVSFIQKYKDFNWTDYKLILNTINNTKNNQYKEILNNKVQIISNKIINIIQNIKQNKHYKFTKFDYKLYKIYNQYILAQLQNLQLVKIPAENITLEYSNGIQLKYPYYNINDIKNLHKRYNRYINDNKIPFFILSCYKNAKSITINNFLNLAYKYKCVITQNKSFINNKYCLITDKLHENLQPILVEFLKKILTEN